MQKKSSKEDDFPYNLLIEEDEFSFIDLSSRGEESLPFSIVKQGHRITVSSLSDLERLFLSEKAYLKILMVLYTSFKLAQRPVETYWLFTSESPSYNVEDIIVPMQNVNYTSVSASEKAILTLTPYLKNKRVLGWGHSHADFSVFFSYTDKLNQRNILMSTSNYAWIRDREQEIAFCYGSTFNIHHEKYALFSYYFLENGTIHYVNREIPVVITSSLTEKEMEQLIKIFLKSGHLPSQYDYLIRFHEDLSSLFIF